ncbi:hypothetical protein SEVIR_5G190500v4 [Setaria viridis]|uniref:Uncharacterized protein n=2 Tax=Setaria TaxID=4554 RepID=K3XIS7_SETIT|nr:uncharacterized protein LOC101786743 [Setaria italica]XP_034592754.1 uncharacterized protein LOC117854633 [Setaria viridis]RCV25723.1 hypothetical protein SETIT_5G188200v2 [Setaria italica]TKW14790.1 hypothetical protein SEVIR_5G190500v2 [Setaria viridis]TKW14791.1 hypothetical protein SEVIR_5G190500v2 [Setaria viridis]
MGKKNSGASGASTPARASNQAVSIRDETSGRTRVDEASLLRVKHLQRLASWAGAEAGVGPVAALLGRRLASSAEAAGVPLGAATFLCQRCETVLKPGFNCSVRIRNKRNKAKRRKKSNCCQNSISYACHFCGDQNLILGSGKGVVKSLLPSRDHATMALTGRILKGNNSNTRIRDRKNVLEHSQAATLQVDSPSGLRQSTSERGEHGERLKCNLSIDCKMEEGAILSMVKPGHLAASTSEEVSIQVVEITNDEQIRETEPISCEKVKICEANATSEAEVPVGLPFVTPQKKKLTEVNSAEPFKTGSKASEKGENSGSITGNTVSSSIKSAPNDSRKNSKCAASDSAQVSGSSRKRAKKGWTTLKQIAEKDELERREKMSNFVIPFFMQ